MLRYAGPELGTNRARGADGDSTRLPQSCVADLGDYRTTPSENGYLRANKLRGEMSPQPRKLGLELINRHRLDAYRTSAFSRTDNWRAKTGHRGLVDGVSPVPLAMRPYGAHIILRYIGSNNSTFPQRSLALQLSMVIYLHQQDTPRWPARSSPAHRTGQSGSSARSTRTPTTATRSGATVT